MTTASRLSPGTLASHAAALHPAATPGRKFNFSAGPGCLPESVLRRAQEEIWDCRNSGVGILEHSHRGKVYDRILAEAEADFRSIGGVGADYSVMFMTGGATSQNYLVPMNFMPSDKSGTADYANTGHWAQQSIDHGKVFGTIHEAASTKGEGYVRVPRQHELKFSPKPVYFHYTSNNTIYGTQFHYTPDAPTGVPLVCDMCSDIFSRPFDLSKFGLIYAGAQKNLGAAGTTIVIARKDLIERGRTDIPVMLQYRVFARDESRPNTPPVFAIYLSGLVFKWIIEMGGLKFFEKHNDAKAKLVYDVLDRSRFFKPHARPDSRSLMNVTFRCPTPQLDDLFVQEADKAGLDALKGHRATGGMRVSLYNAMPMEGAQAIAAFMREFERTKG